MLALELDYLDAILLSAFERMKTIPGKKALQKFVYFLKECSLDVGFQYQWDKWGPYSIELATYVDDLVAEDLLQVRTEKVPFGNRTDSRGIQYNYTIAPKASKFLDSMNVSVREKGLIERVIKLVLDIGTSNLELYASVHYMVKFLTTKGEKARLPDSLVELMDDYKRGRFSDEEIKTAYYNLKGKGWLK